MTEEAWELGRISVTGTIERKQYAFESGARVLSQFALVYVSAGEGFFENGERDRSAVPTGSLLYLVPGEPHRYGPTVPGNWDELFLLFSGRLFDCWRHEGGLDSSRVIGPLLPVPAWARRVQAVIDAAEEHQRDPLVAACELQLLLAEAVAWRDAPHDEEATWRSEVAAAIEAGLRYDFDFHALAQRFGTSYETFRKRFRTLFGQSPHQYLAAEVIRRAAQRLRNPQLLDKEIALELGFSDEHYFSRRFHQLAGMSPTEYRRIHADRGDNAP
jgi:AraC-like DNA-binding protein